MLLQLKLAIGAALLAGAFLAGWSWNGARWENKLAVLDQNALTQLQVAVKKAYAEIAAQQVKDAGIIQVNTDTKALGATLSRTLLAEIAHAQLTPTGPVDCPDWLGSPEFYRLYEAGRSGGRLPSTAPAAPPADSVHEPAAGTAGGTP